MAPAHWRPSKCRGILSNRRSRQCSAIEDGFAVGRASGGMCVERSVEDCATSRIAYNSCRKKRHCPKCPKGARAAGSWLASARQDSAAGRYFSTGLTAARGEDCPTQSPTRTRRWFTKNLLCRTAAQTLSPSPADPPSTWGRPHTCGRDARAQHMGGSARPTKTRPSPL